LLCCIFIPNYQNNFTRLGQDNVSSKTITILTIFHQVEFSGFADLARFCRKYSTVGPETQGRLKTSGTCRVN